MLIRGALVLSLAVTTAVVVGAPAQAADRLQVTGGAHDFTGANVSISAMALANGTYPSGHVNATLPNPRNPDGGTLQFRLEVTCLAVSGNLASIGAVATEATANDVPVGFPFVITVKDSGNASGAGDGLDVFPGTPASACPSSLPLAAASPTITHGNLHVRS